MTTDRIADEANRLKTKYHEDDPGKLAAAMKIRIGYEPLGLYDGCIKGFYIQHNRIRHITVNSDLPKPMQRVILAHELGHCVLHSARSSHAAFHEVTVFDNTDHAEYEANVFAVELLLRDEEVLAALDEGMYFFEMASRLNVPYELLDFKLRILRKRGYTVDCPVEASGDFLKHLERGAEGAIQCTVAPCTNAINT